MNKLKKAFKAIFAILKQPSLLNKIIDSPDLWADYLAKNYNITNGLRTVNINNLFPETTKAISPYTFSDGGSLPTDLLLLKKAAMSFPHCKYFEIGTWRGESVANVAQVASQCYTLNMSDEQMRAINLPEDHIKQIGYFSKHYKNIKHLKGNSLDYDFSALPLKFDLVFIDGNHHHEFVANDTKKVFEHLLHENSIVVWHDYAYHPELVRSPVLAGILDGTPKDLHKNIYHVEGTKSAIYINKNIASFTINKLKLPNTLYTVSVESEAMPKFS